VQDKQLAVLAEAFSRGARAAQASVVASCRNEHASVFVAQARGAVMLQTDVAVAVDGAQPMCRELHDAVREGGPALHAPSPGRQVWTTNTPSAVHLVPSGWVLSAGVEQGACRQPWRWGRCARSPLCCAATMWASLSGVQPPQNELGGWMIAVC
jgi:hypothetical protein